MTWDKLLPMLWEGTVETLYMTLWSSAIAYLIGLPLGVLLEVTRRLSLIHISEPTRH